jgi:CDP-paratose 2-epimerase
VSGSNGRRPVTLVTGGAGFIGTNLTDFLVEEGHRVRIYDSLVRRGVERNLRWLEGKHSRAVEVVIADLRDRGAIAKAVAGAEAVFHCAAQVAVTTSVEDPVDDFGTNVEGTVTLLEQLRRLEDPPPLVFTSTNKVYGSLDGLPLERNGTRWEPADPDLRALGINERRPLDFRTPYGCSKGAADQYVLDYARTYGLPAIVFRMSCVYGQHQHGTEDQGWVAHFLLRALANEPITIYGDGAQVRDLLHVSDLAPALLLARDNAQRLAATPFNVGGGPANALSVLEVVELIAELQGEEPDLRFAEERIGDQRYYVSDTRRFTSATGWRPQTTPQEGIEQLHAWLTRRSRERAGAVRTAAR